MFYALAANKIPTGAHTFEHILQDIQTLNERARRCELDITAVSIHAWAHLTKDYALLPSGASMGDNYGPMLVGKKAFTREELKKVRIAVPGTLTSAYLALQLYLDTPGAALNTVVVPFDEIFGALERGEADVGLIIHEGQLTYGRHDLVLSEDLGKWWFRDTGGLPLPLGGNVIRKSFGEAAMREISDILTASIRYGLEHRHAGVEHALPLGRGLDHDMADTFIGMYVNDLTVDYGDRGRKAIREFLGRAHAKGFIPAPVEVKFVGE
jgi:1,4-dihydroxy-6-naphthoate synthase